MSSSEPFGQGGRLLIAVILVALIAGSMVWYGAPPSYDPSMNDFPDEDDVAAAPDEYVGEEVTLGGAVIETDPVVIEIHDESSQTVTLVDANAALVRGNAPLEAGDDVTAFGTLTDDTTLDVERALTREPWEVSYMYVISFLGGLWVAGRFFQGWRFDRTRLAFVANADVPTTYEESPPSEITVTYEEVDERDEQHEDHPETPPAEPPSGGDR